jgi:hypothetical protein
MIALIRCWIWLVLLPVVLGIASGIVLLGAILAVAAEAVSIWR